MDCFSDLVVYGEDFTDIFFNCCHRNVQGDAETGVVICWRFVTAGGFYNI